LGVRIFALSALTIAGFVAVILILVQSLARQAIGTGLSRTLAATRASVQDKLDARSAAVLAAAGGLAAVPTYLAGVERAIGTGDRGTLLDLADELRTQLGAEWALITDGSGVLQAWSDHPERAGIDLSGGALVGLALQGAATEGIWLEPTERGDAIYQAVGVPFRPAGGGAPLAVLVTALPVDSALAAALRRNTDSEILFFTRDTLGIPVPNVTTLSASMDLARSLGTDTTASRVSIEQGGDTWIGAIGPLRTAGGAPIAGVVGLRSRQAELKPFLALRRGLVWSLAGGLVLALAGSAWLARRITRPVLGLVATTRKVGAGDYSAVVAVDSRDEIGELSRAFQRMVDELREKQRLVDFLSASQATNTGASAAASAPPGAGQPETARPETARPPAAQIAPLAGGTVLANRYQLREVLGSGGMGVVYRAFDRELGETVALKSLHPSLQLADPAHLERFKQEIRLARRITHRNVVRTHDLGEDTGRYFITMEYVEGTSLDVLIRRKERLPADVTITIAKQLLRALQVAHEAGVIHRDIKPANVAVDAVGFVKVMDFGIARLTDLAPAGQAALTQAGAVVGSPDYMAPEQLLGEEVDHRVDLYATGCLMFEALTGRRVYEAPNLLALVARQLEEPVPDVTALAPGLPAGLAAIITKALAKDRKDRWASATEMLEALESIAA
jgi:serine/threonine-protein kinase